MDSKQNVTVVCLKGERGPRGKSGPRGRKGDVGGAGIPGSVGPKGTRGRRGRKGKKGEPGIPGISVEKPTITTKFPISIVKPEATNLTLQCEARGNPAPKVFWEFETGKLDKLRYRFPIDGGLQILDIEERDEGNFKCIAENIFGKDTAAEIKLEVHTKPKVHLFSRQVVGIAGLPIKIECKATGKPVPKLRWKKASGSLNGKVSLSSDNNSIELSLNNPSVSDNGEYVCVAENYVGETNTSFALVILKKFENDCAAWQKRGCLKSGIYQINPGGGKSFYVYCDMVTEGGGWIVIQRRQNEGLDFYRDWNSYKTGFGNPEKEFWLGNEKIHRLTRLKDTKIRLDIEDLHGNKKFAEYDTFHIDNETNWYRARVSGYSGAAENNFQEANEGPFQTKDRSGIDWDCVKYNRDGWWYNNDVICQGDAPSLNTWNYQTAWGRLKKTEMKIKVKN